jgi:hypothetical protein
MINLRNMATGGHHVNLKAVIVGLARISSVPLIAIAFSSCGVYQEIRQGQLRQEFFSNCHQLASNSSKKDWGAPPAKEQVQICASLIRKDLKDPMSAIIKVASIERRIIPRKIADNLPFPWSTPSAAPEPVRAWVLVLSVNAKNSYGAYVGDQLYSIAFENGKCIEWRSPPDGLFPRTRILEEDYPHLR